MKSKLEQLVALFSSHEDKYKSPFYTEAECRLEFLDVLLTILGWDVQNSKGLPPNKKEVFVEHSADLEHHDKPDYTLTLNGVSKFFLEAKKPSVNILVDKNPALQVRRYGWNAKHPIAVLTNFEYLCIYDTSIEPKESDNPDVALYKKFYYKDYLNKFSEINNLISRNSVYSGNFSSWTNALLSTTSDHTPVDATFLEQIDGWRVRLANKLYGTSPNYNNLDYLNSRIQEFVSRMVFLRICEDREIFKYLELKNIIGDGKIPKTELVNLFHESDEKFGAGLFSGEGIVLDLDNSVIQSIVEDLYYPRAHYLFDIIKPHLLGKIYESYLSERLIKNDDGTISLAKKEEFKDRSVVTTPEDVVNLIVDHSVAKSIEGLNYQEIITHSFLDMACGSGVFLESAFDAISSRCLDLGLATETDLDGNPKLPLKTKQDIISHCLFGVDIDIQACQIAKFSLAIKLLEGENYSTLASQTNIVPDLSENIKCGNSLIDINSSFFTPDQLLRINPFEWNTINFGHKFNCIICNPPYVKTEDMIHLLDPLEFSLYKQLYKSAQKQFDKYFVFLEKATHLLADGGMIGFIVPNKFLRIDTAKALREFLSSFNYSIEVLDFGASQLFEDKTIYSCLLFVTNNKGSLFSYQKYDAFEKALDSDATFEYQSKLSHPTYLWITGDEFAKPKGKKYIELAKIADPINGIQTSQERPNVYWFSMDEIETQTESTYMLRKGSSVYAIEKNICKPYFKPITLEEKQIESFDRISTNKLIIFPYRNGELIPEETMATSFPGCWAYLNAYKNVLMPRQLDPKGHRDVPTATPQTWYQYGRTQNLTMFDNKPKLIVKNMFKDNPLFAIDLSGMVISSGGTAGYSALIMKEHSNYDVRFLQAYLMSKTNIRCIKALGSDFEGGFTSIGTSVLKKLWIPDINFANSEEKQFHDDVVSQVKQIESLETFIQSHRLEPNIQRVVEDKQEKIKALLSIFEV